MIFDPVLDTVRDIVRSVVRRIAGGLNTLTGGHLHPNAVTITALIAHVPIAWVIAGQRYDLAAVLLVVFGLFDALDGALARVQQRESRLGMLLDSITDRMKEIIIYIGIAVALIRSGQSEAVVWAVAACGASLLVSYVNAWGEAVVAGSGLPRHQVNQSFRSGLMSFDVRVAVIVAGLATGRLVAAIMAVALLSTLTAIWRVMRIGRALVPYSPYSDGSEQRAAAPDGSSTAEPYHPDTRQQLSEPSGTTARYSSAGHPNREKAN